ncbi:MAG TPA: tRNA (adenosine(37)-N6)-threonylcarbamoyltransferase complex ATPase subunit type 1 TsaE [Thermoanaerobaculia bacterium]|nr:tRNA (adenosine(37)-N6)-threonylcarbamoyltransferase complex ATPase subunit type 1 TsaE [Thermoanaerobaculia bacterium]
MRGVFTTRSEEETERIAGDLARGLRNADVVYLWGDLGAGKTCFTRGLAIGLGAAPREVASPTFSLLHEYASSDGKIILRHLDLYRVEDRAADLEALGVPEVTRGAPVAVEWPGKALRPILPPTIEVRIDPRPDGSRTISIADA